MAAVVVTTAVAMSVLSRSDLSSRTQASGDSDAAPLVRVERDPSQPTVEYAFENGAVDAADSGLLPARVVEDLVNAQENADPDKRERVIADLLLRLVEIDSHAAAQFAERVTEPRLREVSLRVVAQRWAHLSAASATSWAASLGDTRERDQAVSNVALELAQSDPPQAVRLLERQFTTDMPAGIFEGVLQQWAEKNYEDALAWSEMLPPGVQRDLVLERLVFVRANQNPRDAARLADEAFSDSDKRTDALASIAGSWGSRDPASAREWARTLVGQARERVDAELALVGATGM